MVQENHSVPDVQRSASEEKTFEEELRKIKREALEEVKRENEEGKSIEITSVIEYLQDELDEENEREREEDGMVLSRPITVKPESGTPDLDPNMTHDVEVPLAEGQVHENASVPPSQPINKSQIVSAKCADTSVPPPSQPISNSQIVSAKCAAAPSSSSHPTVVHMVNKEEKIKMSDKLEEGDKKEETKGDYTKEHKDNPAEYTDLTMEIESENQIEEEDDVDDGAKVDQMDNENEEHSGHARDWEPDTSDSVPVEDLLKADHGMAKRKRSSVYDEQPIVDVLEGYRQEHSGHARDWERDTSDSVPVEDLQKADHGMAKRKRSSVYNEQPIVGLLESYKQESADSVISKKAIKYLVERLKNKETELASLIEALKSKGASSTRCVTIPRTRSGKVQICFKMYPPQLLFARVWRWPDVTTKEIRKLECCGTCSEDPNTCVNPYHLGRVPPSQIPNDSIVQELQKYTQEGIDPAVVKLVIHQLVNKLENRTVDLEALKVVLKSKGKLPSPCVTIPRTDIRDRIQAGGTTVSSHTIWYRIWRCANVTKQRLRRLACCVTSSDGPSMCVNPYHVERIDLESSKSPRSRSSMKTPATETRSHQSGSDSEEEQDNDHHFDRTSSTKKSLSTSAAVPISSHSMFLEKLMSYRKANVDLEFARKACHYLLNKISVDTMDDLMRVLSTCARQSSTKCVTIPRTADGRINVSGKCYPTHVVYASIWRWPNTLSARYLQRASYCRTTSIYQGVCINPYHYERIAQETKKTEAKTCARLKRKRQNDESVTEGEQLSLRKKGKWEATMCTKSGKGGKSEDRSEEQESVTNEETTDEETSEEEEEEGEKKEDKQKEEEAKEGKRREERSEEMEGEEPERSCPLCSFRGTIDTRQHYKKEHVEKRECREERERESTGKKEMKD